MGKFNLDREKRLYELLTLREKIDSNYKLYSLGTITICGR